MLGCSSRAPCPLEKSWKPLQRWRRFQQCVSSQSLPRLRAERYTTSLIVDVSRVGVVGLVEGKRCRERYKGSQAVQKVLLSRRTATQMQTFRLALGARSNMTYLALRCCSRASCFSLPAARHPLCRLGGQRKCVGGSFTACILAAKHHAVRTRHGVHVERLCIAGKAHWLTNHSPGAS